MMGVEEQKEPVARSASVCTTHLAAVEGDRQGAHPGAVSCPRSFACHQPVKDHLRGTTPGASQVLSGPQGRVVTT